MDAKSYGDVIKHYRWHPEAKSLGPDGLQCTSQTQGILERTSITVEAFRNIGKETDRRWEQGEDISLLEPFVMEYRPNETERLGSDPELQKQLQLHSIRPVAARAGVSEGTVKAARRGDRIRKTSARKLWKTLKR